MRLAACLWLLQRAAPERRTSSRACGCCKSSLMNTIICAPAATALRASRRSAASPQPHRNAAAPCGQQGAVAAVWRCAYACRRQRCCRVMGLRRSRDASTVSLLLSSGVALMAAASLRPCRLASPATCHHLEAGNRASRRPSGCLAARLHRAARPSTRSCRTPR
jgi:hypothetical protein